MDLPDDVRAALFDAGADAVTFNVPLGRERAETLVDRLSSPPKGGSGAVVEATEVVDLGCGRGELLRLAAARMPHARLTGVDTDERLVRRARDLAVEDGVADRVRFEVADAAGWSGGVDAALCVGASHVFDGPAGMFRRLGELVPTGGSAVVGDGIWGDDPDAWCLDTFGPLPHGLTGLAAEAERAGWTVVDADTSTLAEWDQFEQGWIDGVRSVGTEWATAFADRREREYRRYRGVLGFGWLVLRR